MHYLVGRPITLQICISHGKMQVRFVLAPAIRSPSDLMEGNYGFLTFAFLKERAICTQPQPLSVPFGYNF